MARYCGTAISSRFLLLCLCGLLLAVFPAACFGGVTKQADSPAAAAVVEGVAWSSARKLELRETVREMIHHAFGNYMQHAFPHDELKPISRTWTDSMAELGNAPASAPTRTSTARGKPYHGFALTLIDSLSTLAVVGHREEFCAGVDWLVRHLDFNVDLRLHLFEANIRMLGGLLSAHLLLTDPVTRNWLLPAGGVTFASLSDQNKGERVQFVYKDGLLVLAKDLGERLLKAFPSAQPVTPPKGTPSSPSQQAQAEARARAEVSSLPYAFVHLAEGVLPRETESTCAAGAGTFIVEFGMLSAITGDRRFRDAADAALMGVWSMRDPITQLLPNSFDRNGSISDPVSSLGSGIDSIYEYLAKGAILFDSKKYLDMFTIAFQAAERHLKINVVYEQTRSADVERPRRTLGNVSPFSMQRTDSHIVCDWYLEARFSNGQHAHLQFNSLSSFYPACQVLAGRVEEARGMHSAIYSLWKQFSALPERFFILTGQLHNSEKHYPLRPELAESTYYLYQATKDDLYLDAAARIVTDLNKYARVPGGFATIRDVTIKPDIETNPRPHDDRMESFFIAELLKYLYLTFDDDHWLHHIAAGRSSGTRGAAAPGIKPITTSWVFSTEGHLFPVRNEIQKQFSDDEQVYGLLATAHPDLPIWDAKRRLDERTLVVGMAHAQAEVATADSQGKLNPLLREWVQSAPALKSSPNNLNANAPPSVEGAHKWAHIGRYREGFLHHPLVSRGEDPKIFERDYAYYLRRLHGEVDARGGTPNAAFPPNPPAGTPLTGEIERSTTLPAISVRDALLLPCNQGGCAAHDAPLLQSPLSAMQCARPTHLRINLGAPPNYWWAYDREWLRWTYKRQLEAARMQSFELWKLQRAVNAAAKVAATSAAGIAASAAAAGTSTPVAPAHAGPKHELPPPNQFIHLNGQKIPLPASVSNMLQQQQQQRVQQQQQRRHAGAQGDLDGLGPGDAVKVGTEFSVENEAGSFHIIHHSSASSMTIRNLGSSLVEIMSEVELQPDVPADERGPVLRTGLLTMDDTGAISSYSVHVSTEGICEGTLPAVDGYFGRMPPVFLHNGGPGDVAAQEVFLRDSNSDPSFDALAHLATMPAATSNQDGLLRGNLVRAHPALACSPISEQDAALFRGNIVLVERGQCTFVEKALFLQAVGAIGMIVWNRSQPNYLFVMGSDYSDRQVFFPALMIDEHTGAWLSRCISKNERAFAAEVIERAAAPSTSASEAKYRPLLRVSMWKRAHASGAVIPVAVFPSFLPLGSSTLPADQAHLLEQRPTSMTLTGHVRRFTATAQHGWTATVTYDEQQQNYVLDLFDAPRQP